MLFRLLVCCCCCCCCHCCCCCCCCDVVPFKACPAPTGACPYYVPPLLCPALIMSCPCYGLPLFPASHRGLPLCKQLNTLILWLLLCQLHDNFFTDCTEL